MRPLLALLLLVPLVPATAHPLDGARVDLCALPTGHAGAPLPLMGRFTIADQPDSAHVGRLGFTAYVTLLVDGAAVGTGRVAWDGWFWSTVVFDAPGRHTLQAAWGSSWPYPAMSDVVEVDIAEGSGAPTGMTLAPACYLAYREPGFVRMFVPMLGTMPAPEPLTWRAATGGVHILAPTACWNDGCDLIVSEQLSSFSAVAWGEVDEEGRPLSRSAFAGVAGPFTYRSGDPLPSCVRSLQVRAWAHADGAPPLAAEARDGWIGGEPSRACG